MDDRTPQEKQQDEQDDEYGPDPDLYARMSEPYVSRAAAEVQLKKFLLGVKRLREECGVAEVMLMAGNHFTKEEGKEDTTSCMSLALGNPDFRPEFGAMAYQQYTLPEVLKAARWAKVAITPDTLTKKPVKL
jgi:hypothetical protein